MHSSRHNPSCQISLIVPLLDAPTSLLDNLMDFAMHVAAERHLDRAQESTSKKRWILPVLRLERSKNGEMK